MDATDLMLPNNLEVERTVLGYVLMHGKVDFIARAEDFYLEAHRKLFSAMIDLQNLGRTIDLVTAINELRRRGELEQAGGAAYVAGLTDGIPRMQAPPDEYMAIVRHCSALRRLIQATNESMVRAYQNQDTFQDITESLIATIDDAQASLEPGLGLVSIDTSVSETYKEIEEIDNAHRKGITSGLQTGLRDLDMIIPGGFKASDFVIVGGRPSQGKTSLLLGFLVSMAKAGKRIAFFSIEMAITPVIMRLLAMIAEMNLLKLSTGWLNKDDWIKLGRAAAEISQWKVYIDDSTGIQVSDMRSRIRRLREPIDALMLDYVQIVNVPKHLQSSNDNAKTAHVSTALRFLGRTMKIPVIATSQLSRAPTKRKNARPQLSDLRQSGQIEQDCDIAILIHREENDDDDAAGSVAELIVAKHRNGPTGTARAAFIGHWATFANLWPEGGDSPPTRWYDK